MDIDRTCPEDVNPFTCSVCAPGSIPAGTGTSPSNAPVSFVSKVPMSIEGRM